MLLCRAARGPPRGDREASRQEARLSRAGAEQYRSEMPWSDSLQARRSSTIDNDMAPLDYI